MLEQKYFIPRHSAFHVSVLNAKSVTIISSGGQPICDAVKFFTLLSIREAQPINKKQKKAANAAINNVLFKISSSFDLFIIKGLPHQSYKN